MLFQEIVFWTLAVASVVSAIAVIQVQDIFRAALFLVVTFLTIAGLFVMLNAEFLAAVQVLVYAGAISVLIIFAIMVTRDVHRGNPSNRLRVPALVVASLVLVAIVFVVSNTSWPLLSDATLSAATLDRVREVFADTPGWMAVVLLKDWVLPFEVVSVLLLAALLGALALLRER